MSVMKTQTDSISDTDLEVAMRGGIAWRELRRGAMASDVRDVIYGVGGSAIEPGQMDALDLLVTVPSCRMSELAEYLHIDPTREMDALSTLRRRKEVDVFTARLQRGVAHFFCACFQISQKMNVNSLPNCSSASLLQLTLLSPRQSVSVVIIKWP